MHPRRCGGDTYFGVSTKYTLPGAVWEIECSLVWYIAKMIVSTKYTLPLPAGGPPESFFIGLRNLWGRSFAPTAVCRRYIFWCFHKIYPTGAVWEIECSLVWYIAKISVSTKYTLPGALGALGALGSLSSPCALCALDAHGALGALGAVGALGRAREWRTSGLADGRDVSLASSIFVFCNCIVSDTSGALVFLQ